MFGLPLESASFWSLVAFIVAFGFALPPMIRAIGSMIRQGINAIAQDIKNAEKLSRDAENLHRELLNKTPLVEKEAAQIIEDAHALALLHKKEMEEVIAKTTARRNLETKNRIHRLNRDAFEDIKHLLIDLTKKSAEHIILEELKEREQDDLMKNIIANLGDALKKDA